MHSMSLVLSLGHVLWITLADTVLNVGVYVGAGKLLTQLARRVGSIKLTDVRDRLDSVSVG